MAPASSSVLVVAGSASSAVAATLSSGTGTAGFSVSASSAGTDSTLPQPALAPSSSSGVPSLSSSDTVKTEHGKRAASGVATTQPASSPAGLFSTPATAQQSTGFQAVVATSAAGTTAVAATASQVVATTATMPSEIKDLNLNEVVNKWTEEIADIADQFDRAANLVSKWDRAIVANEDRIHALHRDAESLQIAHKELSSNLEIITSQQTELHSLLDALETDVERKLGANGVGSGAFSNGGTTMPSVPADVEREAMHRLAAEVMEELDAMALTIRDLVIDLNKNSGASTEDGVSDTVSQIISVLNSHLDSLQYLDETSSTLQKRIGEVSRACETASRDVSRMYPRRPGALY